MIEISVIYPGELRFHLFTDKKHWERYCESLLDGSPMPSFLMCQDEDGKTVFIDMSKCLGFYIIGNKPKRKRAKNNKTAGRTGDELDS